MIQFPVTENGNSSHDIPLYGKIFTFEYKYNSRNKRIYLTISLGGVVLISGLRLVTYGTPLQQYSIQEFPPVQLFVAWLGSDSLDPTLGNFGINKEFSLIGLEWSDF